MDIRNRMKRSTSLLFTLPLTFATLSSQAQEYNKPYQEPSRGFFIEHGSVKTGEYSSLEFHTGAAELDTGGGIRLGLPQAELIINSGLNTYDFATNEVMLKWGMPTEKNTEREHTEFSWALIGEIGTINRQDNTDQTNIKLGAAATIKADAGTFTLAPYLVFADSDNGGTDDTFLEVELGAYIGIIDTQSGLFSAGFEAFYSGEDDIDEQFALGARWMYNETINIDIVPLIYNNNDLRGIPGLVRLNVVF